MKLRVLGDATEEARIWDLVVEGRSLVTKTKRKRDVNKLSYMALYKCSSISSWTLLF